MYNFTNLPDVIGRLRKDYAKLNERRKMIYEPGAPGDLILGGEEPKYREIENVAECFSQLYSTEPKLINNMTDKNPFLQTLSKIEKQKILIHLVANMHAIETSYLSWRYSEFRDETFLVLPNRTYLDISQVNNSNLHHDVFEDSSVNKQNIIRTFQLSVLSLTKMVNEQIKMACPAYDEFVFLIGLKLYDPSTPNISTETQLRLQTFRNLLIEEMAFTYKKLRLDSEGRVEMLLTVSKNLEEYALRLREDMLLYRCFNIVRNHDQFLDNIWGICVDL